MSKPYCGVGQIRRYGIIKIDEKMKTSNKEQLKKSPIKILSSVPTIEKKPIKKVIKKKVIKKKK